MIVDRDSDLDPGALRFKLWAEMNACCARVACAESDAERAEWNAKLAEARARFNALCGAKDRPS